VYMHACVCNQKRIDIACSVCAGCVQTVKPYKYMEDLKELELRGKAGSRPISSSGKWSQIVTPLKVEEWKRCLEPYPDRGLYSYIVDGLSEGFWIGFDHQHLCREAKSNMLSALRNPKVVEEYLAAEIE